MSAHSYPLSAVAGDYLRAGVGILIALIPLVFVPPKPVVTTIFGVAICVFAAYAVRTVIRHKSRIEMSDEKIAVTLPRQKEIRWSEMRSLRLKYFSTRSKWSVSKGWFQLVLSDGGQSIAVESTISDFHRIAERATQAAGANGIALDEASAANMAAMELSPGGASP